MPVPIKTLLASFNLPLQHRDITRWRGAFSKMAGWEHDLLHNHTTDGGIMYRYPLIQYRVHKGKAAIFALNNGINTLQTIIAQAGWQLNWKKKPYQLLLESFDVKEHNLKMLDRMRTYHIETYICLNKANYDAWHQQPGLVARASMLEKVLVGHILGFSRMMELDIPNRSLQVTLLDIYRQQTISLHKNTFLTFDLRFSANIQLPSQIGLGGKTAFGCGRISYPD